MGGLNKLHAHAVATPVIDSTHKNIHEGYLWHIWVKPADGAQVVDNGQINIVFDLSAVSIGENIHVVWEAEAGGDAEVQVWETITYTGGTAFTPINMNRANPKTSTNVVVVYTASVTTTSATQLDGVWIPGGVRSQSVGGASRGGMEWIFAGGVKYAIIFINRAGAGKDMSLSATYYED